jgi:hypothetical protein
MPDVALSCSQLDAANAGITDWFAKAGEQRSAKP